MEPSLAERLAPPPFLFHPEHPGRRAPAFSRTFRLLATALVAAIGSWMYRLWQSGKLVPPGTSDALALGWPLAALAIILYTWWYLQTSWTTVTETELRQRWMWDKKLDLRELAYAKLIRVPGLDWLIAPRLYARTLLGKFAVFYCADRVMLAEFERLVSELKDLDGGH